MKEQATQKDAKEEDVLEVGVQPQAKVQPSVFVDGKKANTYKNKGNKNSQVKRLFLNDLIKLGFKF